MDVSGTCIGSRTACWEAKLVFLHSRVGSHLVRLKWLIAVEVPVEVVTVVCAALDGGHADALAFLWDEAGVPVPALLMVQQGVSGEPWALTHARGAAAVGAALADHARRADRTLRDVSARGRRCRIPALRAAATIRSRCSCSKIAGVP
ncbi:hypothetical protein CHLRE_13g576433v5 [Chlamydomonas reinhardtii]|uniref:Uncharacterized protein n=1 Tax=Chlamydomonas reinhardtii TaxID=3055 RepID=A0A2K3D008_CHLRE|nr:uncharacterized protein CHLRE_13g576433v5 [Chlamydomonas reinhardtii]PNW73875.1 hypothetical protein CHLRE_13g576433v5 [Chlamydomonas reinhardtii]